MIIKQHKYVKQQFETKCKELKSTLDNPNQHIGFLNILRDVEYLYLYVKSYEDAINDINNLIKDNPLPSENR